MVYRGSARARAKAAGPIGSSSSGVRSTPSLEPTQEERPHCEAPVWRREITDTTILRIHGEEWYHQKWNQFAARLLTMKKTGYICGALPHLIADVRAERRKRAEKPPDPTVMDIIQHNRVARRLMRRHGGPTLPDPPGHGQNGPPIHPGNHETVTVTIERTITVGVRTPGTSSGTTHNGSMEAPPGLH